MQIKADEISKIIRDHIGNFSVDVDVAEVGTVVSVGDGIARIQGVERAMAGEMLEFPNGLYGVALNLEEESVGAVLLGHSTEIKEGDVVKRTGRIADVPVGPEVVGRVLDALGQPIDGKGPFASKQSSEIERLAPGVVDRSPVKEPLQTGLKAIDAMVPIGPFPSIGWPSAFTTRPSSSSPTGTEMIRPVRLTTSPSLISLNSPRSTVPTLSSSRFRAIPYTPCGNSSISPAIAFSTPWTRAIPSPIVTMLPTSATSTSTA